MLVAGWWGFVGGLALLLGAVIALRASVSQKTIGLIMAFGVGVLISAVAFELTEEAFANGGGDSTGLGLALGAFTFYFGDTMLDRRGAEHRKRSSGQQEGSQAGMAIVLGALLDGIPESAVIGISLVGGEGVSVVMVVAVFLSNVPEALSATTGLKAAGRSAKFVMVLWSGVAAVSALAAMIGYTAMSDASCDAVALIQGFAAGAILTMLANTMFPEAYGNGGREVGLVTVLGFIVASALVVIGA